MANENDLEHTPACRQCGILLFWAKHALTGHWLPLELVPTAYRITATTAEPIKGPVYIAHAITCPGPGGGRRRGRGRRLP